MKLEPASDIKLIYCTMGSESEARQIGTLLVEQQLAACVNILPVMHSIYRWEGNVESATEAVLLIKTIAAQIPAVEQLVKQQHSYECPAFLVLPVESGSEEYLNWLRTQVGGIGQ